MNVFYCSRHNETEEEEKHQVAERKLKMTRCNNTTREEPEDIKLR